MQWVSVLALLVAIALAVALLLLMDLRVEMVKEGQRVPVYRFGRFSRIEGPGAMRYSQSFESLGTPLDVRDRVQDFTVPELFVNQVSLGVTLRCHFRLDPKEATSNNRDAMARIVVHDEGFRYLGILTDLQDSFVHRTAELAARKPVPQSATLIELLTPILPGLPDSDRILNAVKTDIEPKLRRLGVILDPGEPIVIVQLHLPEELTANVDWLRSQEALKRQAPDLPDTLLARIFALFAGSELTTFLRNLPEGPAGTNQLDWYVRSQMEPKDRRLLELHGDSAESAHTIDYNELYGYPKPTQRALDDELTPADLRILKKVPKADT